MSDLAALAEALRKRISDDTDLLGTVLRMMVDTPPSSTMDDWVPIGQIAEKTNGKISEATARWMARNRDENGCANAFRKVGRKLLVNPGLLMNSQK